MSPSPKCIYILRFRGTDLRVFDSGESCPNDMFVNQWLTLMLSNASI